MYYRGFWDNLHVPVIGLAPMDGVTDAAFRYITDRHGHPSLLFTEFTSVEGLDRGITGFLSAFICHRTETPTIAQVFGITPQAFYRSTLSAAALGFSGVDINMGCPDKNVARRGGGAGLIQNPQLAKAIISSAKQAAKDWVDDITLKQAQIHPDVVSWIVAFQKTNNIFPARTILPISVKTRIGYDKIVTKEWVSYLLETEPANITIHGRTLKQLYSGEANWDEIAVAAEIAHHTKTSLLGNGDVCDRQDAINKINTYKTDGVLIGRSSFGNPWVFTTNHATPTERLAVAIEHAVAFKQFTPALPALSLRKHMSWYCKGFENAHALRIQLMTATTADEMVEHISRWKLA